MGKLVRAQTALFFLRSPQDSYKKTKKARKVKYILIKFKVTEPKEVEDDERTKKSKKSSGKMSSKKLK